MLTCSCSAATSLQAENILYLLVVNACSLPGAALTCLQYVIDRSLVFTEPFAKVTDTHKEDYFEHNLVYAFKLVADFVWHRFRSVHMHGCQDQVPAYVCTSAISCLQASLSQASPLYRLKAISTVPQDFGAPS